MKGNDKVIARLNETLIDEFTAIHQYFIHAEMEENWGYKKLSSYVRRQSIDEMKHAETLIERILVLQLRRQQRQKGLEIVGDPRRRCGRGAGLVGWVRRRRRYDGNRHCCIDCHGGLLRS